MSEDWLTIEPTQNAPSAATPPPAADDWLQIEDANAHKVSLPFQALVDACMRGTDRVMACDGRWLAYRPYNREKDKETNPRTKERMAMFLASGKYVHVGTYDEVQIYELTEGNPYRHNTGKQYVVGQSYWRDIKQAAQLAYDRNWSEYHDFLGGMATALKSGNRHPGFARTMFEDAVNQICVQFERMPGAPSEKEVNDGLIEIRRARGINGAGKILLNSNALQKVQVGTRK